MTNDSGKPNEESKLTDHNYDGIQEFDNPLPNWWVMIFAGSVIFAFLYLIHYTVGGGDTQNQELAHDLNLLPQTTEKEWQENELIGKIDQPEILSIGKTLYTAKCSACHGVSGEGVIGPNLTDHFWIHGKGLRKDIIQVVAKGVLEKGMPAWRETLSEDELLAVSGYIYSLKGSKPANPKAAQGEASPSGEEVN